MPISLDELLNLPPDLDEEHLRRLNLLPPPAPPQAAPSIIPNEGEPVKVPAMSPVTVTADAPATEATHETAPKLQPLTPQVSPDAVAPMKPPTYLESPQNSMMGFQSREGARRAGEDLSAPVSAGPTLPTTESGRQEVELARLRDEQKHPWGTPENHPGFFGKLGHVLSRVGNIAGDIVAPSTMALIPGTDLNRRVQQGQTERRLETAQTQEREAGKAKSEEELQHAEAYAKMHPEMQIGRTAEEKTFASLLNTINPDTGKNYTDEEAFRKVNQDKAEVKPDTAVQISQRMAANDVKLRNDPTVLSAQERDELAEAQRKDAQTKIPEEIRAKIADPPVPSDKKYALGYGDPQYQKDKQAWIQSYDKAISDTPQAKATAAQREFTNEMRRESAEFQKEKQKTAEDEKQRKNTVIGIDPKTNKQVLVSEKEADAMGLTHMVNAQGSDVSKAMSARQWIPLAAARGKNPEDMGILQLVDELDKKKQLGPLASRWNEFMVGTWGGGTGDPETDNLFEALRGKIGLSQTLLMNAHVGNRGGSYMLEKFEDLANAKRLNADLLRTGVKTELNYIRDRAMEPTREGGGGPNPPEGKSLVYDPNGAPHFANTKTLDDMLKDPKYKGWSKNAPGANANPGR